MDSLAGLKPRGRQTLVVDQAEEAVTVCADPAERERYFAALAAHVGAGGALVLSLRADHLGDLAPYPDIARVLEDGLYLLGPMSEPDLRSAIEGPARRAGLRLEPGLVDLLVREVEGEPAALPLLSHVLRETWERREGPTLTVGGLPGHRRDPARGRPSPPRRCTTRWTTPSAPSCAACCCGWSCPPRTATRCGPGCRAPRSPPTTQHRRLVEQLVDARLVSIDGDTRPDRPRGAGAGLAAAARLARRRRRRAAPLPAPGRRRRRLGRDGPSRQRALPGRPAQPHRWSGETAPRRT